MPDARATSSAVTATEACRKRCAGRDSKAYCAGFAAAADYISLIRPTGSLASLLQQKHRVDDGSTTHQIAVPEGGAVGIDVAVILFGFRFFKRVLCNDGAARRIKGRLARLGDPRGVCFCTCAR
jgi:hypothetical protein